MLLDMINLFIQKYIIASFVVIIVIVRLIALKTYKKIYKPNINKSEVYLYIPTWSEYRDVIEIIKKDTFLIDIDSFKWLARKKNYANHVYPGRYVLDSSMSNNDIIDKLRAGFQDPVKVIFNSIRTREQLAGRIAKQIEPDSLALVKLFYNDSLIASFGLKQETFTCIFLPNTYEFWWNTSAENLVKRMHKEYQLFWNEERREKANKLNLTPEEIITLASIVDEETYYNTDDWKRRNPEGNEDFVTLELFPFTDQINTSTNYIISYKE